MNISATIKTIPHMKHRYATLGDYVWKISKSSVVFKIFASRELGIDSAFLVLLHEFVEMILCIKHGVTDGIITEWDVSHPDENDPGAIRGCPYYFEHMTALKVEKCVADAMGVDWPSHNRKLKHVFYRFQPPIKLM